MKTSPLRMGKTLGISMALVALAGSPAALLGQHEPRLAGSGALPMSMPGAGVDVLTSSYNNGRTGSNERETTLTPANVGGLKKLFSLNVMGDPAHADDPRLEAQPLIVTGLNMNDGKVHDVIYICTMQNNVWAFDANTGDKIWQAPVSLGAPVRPHVLKTGERGFDPAFPTRSEIDLWGINFHWGILSTPVIDRETQTMYVVNWVGVADDTTAGSFFQVHAISLVDGREKSNSPQRIEASAEAQGHPEVKFLPPVQKQRSALLLLPLPNAHMRSAGSPTVLSGGHGEGTAASMPVAPNNVLIMACGMMSENTQGEHGWVLAFDPVTLKTTAAFCTTPQEGGGGIWQAGQGPAADSAGNVYVITSNGGWNGASDFAESFLQLHYTAPAAPGTTGKLELTDWFTPYRDDDRPKAEPGTGYPFQDQDLGSAGPVVPPGFGLVFGAGKDGVLYTLGTGQFGRTDEHQMITHTQYQHLKSPPIFFTYLPPVPNALQIDASVIANLNHNYGGKTHHLHHSPVFWNSPDLGPMLFCWGENSKLRAWSVTTGGKVNFLATGNEMASAALANSPTGLGGMPGGMLALSCNAQSPHTGIVWATVPIDGDGNRHAVAGIVRAYDATDFQNGAPDKVIKLLWDSQKVGVNFTYAKFCPPVVANGKLYVPTYDGRVDVYGLEAP